MFLDTVHAAANASPGIDLAVGFVAKFNQVILYPLITLLIAVAILVFMFGAVQYITNSENPAAREKGSKHIMWGIVGLLVMLTAFAILSVAANTFGVKNVLDCAKDPTASGCNNQVFNLPSS